MYRESMKWHLDIDPLPGSCRLILDEEMTGKQRSTGGTESFYLPAICGLLRNIQAKLAAFLPPLGNISQTCYPNWQWLIM